MHLQTQRQNFEVSLRFCCSQLFNSHKFANLHHILNKSLTFWHQPLIFTKYRFCLVMQQICQYFKLVELNLYGCFDEFWLKPCVVFILFEETMYVKCTVDKSKTICIFLFKGLNFLVFTLSVLEITFKNLSRTVDTCSPFQWNQNFLFLCQMQYKYIYIYIHICTDMHSH